MNIFNNADKNKKKLEYAKDESFNIKDFYYFDSNDMMQFNSNFDKWCKK